ncbi:hypothetical protein B0H34DRAFT_738389, partial [Crassisporium funariophilum]
MMLIFKHLLMFKLKMRIIEAGISLSLLPFSVQMLLGSRLMAKERSSVLHQSAHIGDSSHDKAAIQLPTAALYQNNTPI